MSINANKDVITRFITAVWNGSNLDVLDEFLDPAYYDYSYEPRNREGLEHTLLIMQAAFPGHETIIEEIVGEGDTVAVCLTLRGTHSGPFRGFRFYKVRDDKVTSHRGLLDLPSLLQQIGTND